MVERRITHIKTDNNGEIISVYNHEDIWSPRKIEDVIEDIEKHGIKYFVLNGSPTKINVEIVNGLNGKYIRSVKDGIVTEHLKKLPKV